MPRAVVVLGADALARLSIRSLAVRDVEVIDASRNRLADMAVTLRAGQLRLEGRLIGAMLLRVSPSGLAAPGRFAGADRGFVLAELSATILAASHLGRMLSVNRLDAESWFEEGAWTVWRKRLARAGIPVAPMSFGDRADAQVWRPYCGGAERPPPSVEVRRFLGTALAHTPTSDAALCVFGQPLTPVPATVRDAAAELSAGGVPLAAISFDGAGRITVVDPFPAVPEPQLERVATRLTDVIVEHLHRR